MAIQMPDFSPGVAATDAASKLSDLTSMDKAKKFLTGPGAKGAGTGMFATWLLNKILQTGHETGLRNIQREGLRSQAELVTPENLYYQAAQPAAQAEETQAREALFAQLSGGVLGPQLAKGEFSIGG